MLRSISGNISDRKAKYIIKDSESSKLAEIIKVFLKEEFGEKVASKYRLTLKYNRASGILSVKTDSKIFTNELFLRREDIKIKLTNGGLKIKQIILS